MLPELALVAGIVQQHFNQTRVEGALLAFQRGNGILELLQGRADLA